METVSGRERALGVQERRPFLAAVSGPSFCGIRAEQARVWGRRLDRHAPWGPTPSGRPGGLLSGRRPAEGAAGGCHRAPEGACPAAGQAAAWPAMRGPAAPAGGTSWSGGSFPGTWAWGAGARGAGRAERARAMARAGGAEPAC